MIMRIFALGERTGKDAICRLKLSLIPNIPTRILDVIRWRIRLLVGGKRWFWHDDIWYYISPLLVERYRDDKN